MMPDAVDVAAVGVIAVVDAVDIVGFLDVVDVADVDVVVALSDAFNIVDVGSWSGCCAFAAVL